MMFLVWLAGVACGALTALMLVAIARNRTSSMDDSPSLGAESPPPNAWVPSGEEHRRHLSQEDT